MSIKTLIKLLVMTGTIGLAQSQLLTGAELVTDNRFPVRIGEKIGYIDAGGALVIPNLYYEGRDFSEGLAAVRIGEKWGYIDTSNQVRIPLTFQTRLLVFGRVGMRLCKRQGWLYRYFRPGCNSTTIRRRGNIR